MPGPKERFKRLVHRRIQGGAAMTVSTVRYPGLRIKSVSPAIPGLSPDLPEIVALRRDRWFDGPEIDDLAELP